MTEIAIPHIGRKIERVRILKGMKQETLANKLGITQAAISSMEHSQTIEDEKLDKVAEALGVSVETIKNFNEDAILNLIQNNNENSSNNFLIAYQYNPIEKIAELYERLLAAEKEKVKHLEDMLKKQ